MSIVLYVEPHWVSPYVFACMVTLREKGLDFEARPLDASRGETRASSYLSQTITGRVPSLVHDGFAVAESSAIVEYLEETFPEPAVLPRAPRERARCRQLMSWLRSDDTAALRTERPTTTMFYERARAPLGEAAARSAEKVIEVAGRVIRPGAPHLFDEWCIVDAELAFMLHRMILSGDAVPSGVRAWAEAAWGRPSVRSFVDIVRPPIPQA